MFWLHNHHTEECLVRYRLMIKNLPPKGVSVGVIVMVGVTVAGGGTTVSVGVSVVVGVTGVSVGVIVSVGIRGVSVMVIGLPMDTPRCSWFSACATG